MAIDLKSLELGQKVRFKVVLVAAWDKYPHKVWKRVPSAEREGIITGLRTKWNGTYHLGNWEDSSYLDKTEAVPTVLVVVNIRHEPFIVSPEDLELVE